MKRKQIYTVAMIGTLVTSLFWGAYQDAHAVLATGTARATVIAALSIANVSDLDFGEGTQGGVAKIVAPGASENAENGSFNVTGEANRSYTITLPSNITMTTGDGVGVDKQIVVNSFQSSPSITGNTGAGGSQTLFIGATRAALGGSQVAGSYIGTYSVTVVY